MLHAVMEKILGKVASKKFSTAFEQSEEAAEGLADDEKDYIRFCCRKADLFIALKPSVIKTELKVSVVDENGKKFNYGSLDVLYLFGPKAIIQDFKFGWIPVHHAQENLQGINYAVGVLQTFREVETVGVQFVQPKLNFCTSGKFARQEIGSLFQRLYDVVARAKFVHEKPAEAQKFMKPGGYCAYCTAAGDCSMLNNHRAKFMAKYGELPVPQDFKGLTITDPANIALARYYVTVIESGVEEVKRRAFEIAEANGGEISCKLPSGEVIIYQVAERNAARSLGSAVEVAEALKDVCSYEEILGAADLALTRLEPIVKQARVDLAAAQGQKLTKKAAWEEALSALEANGLLTRSEQKIRFLKQKKTTTKEPMKQIGETNG